MAVYDRAYREYAGALTPERWRFLVLARYAFRDVFRTRMFTAFYVGCFLFPLASAVIVYLRHNASAIAMLQLPPGFLAIDAKAALLFMEVQGIFLGFLIAFVVGPGLVSPDLKNNAMPLYLSRPLSRTEYVAGKLTVLVTMLSLITWVPGLLLFLLQSYLEGWGWTRANLQMAWAIVVASWLWILVLSLLALAISAAVRWRPLASGALLGVFFVAGAMGAVVNKTLETAWGSLIDLGAMVQTVWFALFGIQVVVNEAHVPLWAAWVSLACWSGVSILLLARKIRAYEVVR